MSKNFRVYQKTTLNDLKKWIIENTLKLSFNGKQFGEVVSIKFQSRHCIFHDDTWKGGKNEDIPILQLYNSKEIPSILPLNDVKSSYQNYSYNPILRIKNKYKYDYTKTIPNFPKVLPRASYFLARNSNNNGNYNRNDNLNSRGFSVYKTDSLTPLSYSEIDQKYGKLWDQHKLNRKKDEELIQLLLNMFEKHLIESKYCFNTIENELFRIKMHTLEKMEHQRHREMGYPLTKSQLMSLLLYIETSMHQVLSNEKTLNGKFEKYIVFDYCLFFAITKLHHFKQVSKIAGIAGKHKHKRQIYSGAAGIQLNIKDFVNIDYDEKQDEKEQDHVKMKSKRRNSLDFIMHTSFSVYKETAYGFSTCPGKNSGIVVILDDDDKHIVSADVSWLSPYPHEGEILVRRHCGSTINAVVYNSDFTRQIVLLGDAKLRTQLDGPHSNFINLTRQPNHPGRSSLSQLSQLSSS